MDDGALIMMGKVAIADGVLSMVEEQVIRDYAASINVNPEVLIANLASCFFLMNGLSNLISRFKW